MNGVEILLIQISCAVLMSSFSAYLAGRVHQWRRQDSERDTAFREGFSLAARAMAATVARVDPTQPTAPPAPTLVRGR